MAVYTDVSFEDLEIFLAQYDIGSAQAFKGIAEGVENSNFYLTTDRGAYILTLYEKRVNAGDLPFFLGLMEHLAARGLACPTPVPTKRGALSVTLNGRNAAILTFLQGLSLRSPTAEHCAEAGRALADLHRKGADFRLKRANSLGPKGWEKLAADCATRADEVTPGLAALIAEELPAIANAWPNALPQGVVHADLFPDNVLFLNHKVSGLIDFYFACNDALAYDLAVMLNAWCFEADGSYNLTKGRALIAGYRTVRELEPQEIAALPTLARGAALRFLLTRLYDWLNRDVHALVRPKDPREYLRKLRFHRGVSGAEAYGI